MVSLPKNLFLISEVPTNIDLLITTGAVTKLMAERPEAVWQIITAIAAIETVTLFKNGQGAAGDLGFDPLDLQTKLGFKSDEGLFNEMKLREQIGRAHV